MPACMWIFKALALKLAEWVSSSVGDAVFKVMQLHRDNLLLTPTWII